jgi:hypothetical protein
METLLYKPDMGETIDHAAEIAIGRAVNAQKDCAFIFNGHCVVATPFSQVEEIVAEYRTKCQEALEAYKASPEGIAEEAERQRQREEDAAREAAGPVHDEAEMREAPAAWPQTQQELNNVIEGLVNGKHTYGTAAYAMSLAAMAAFNYVASTLGASGFQAGAASLDIIQRQRGFKGPFAIVKAADLLWPQLEPVEELTETMKEWQDWLKVEAMRLLNEESEGTHPDVIAHWKKLAGVSDA